MNSSSEFGSAMGRDYRHIWTTATAGAAGIFLIPFFLFCVLFDAQSRDVQALLVQAIPAITLGLVLAAVGAVCAVRYLKKANDELNKALELADIRERERDLAQQELVLKIVQERESARTRMQFESQLAEYEKYAALAQLALGAAHEINNPLLGILGHLELELRHARDEEDHIEIEQCIEGTKRISSTIRGLLNYTRPGPLLVTKINLNRLVEDTFGFVKHQPMFRGITLQKEIPAGLPDISADSNQVSQILMNLILNAAQAIPAGGKIIVSAVRAQGREMIEVRVRDTGSGIPAEVLPHVFEPFFTTKRGKGTGLGLSICQSYVKSHGGEIKIESSSSFGTTVYMALPIKQEGCVSIEEEVIA